MSTALHGSTYPMRKMSCFLDKKTIFKCRIDASGNPPPPTSDGTPLNQDFSVSLLFIGRFFFMMQSSAIIMFQMPLDGSMQNVQIKIGKSIRKTT